MFGAPAVASEFETAKATLGCELVFLKDSKSRLAICPEHVAQRRVLDVS